MQRWRGEPAVATASRSETVERFAYLVDESFPTLPVGAALIPAKGRRSGTFSGPNLSETNGFQFRGLWVRSDKFVFENACVRASRQNTADQQMRARCRTCDGNPCAGNTTKRLERADLPEGGAVAVMQGALQI